MCNLCIVPTKAAVSQVSYYCMCQCGFSHFSVLWFPSFSLCLLVETVCLAIVSRGGPLHLTQPQYRDKQLTGCLGTAPSRRPGIQFTGKLYYWLEYFIQVPFSLELSDVIITASHGLEGCTLYTKQTGSIPSGPASITTSNTQAGCLQWLQYQQFIWTCVKTSHLYSCSWLAWRWCLVRWPFVFVFIYDKYSFNNSCWQHAIIVDSPLVR